jgi:hypothetical protein
MSKSEFKISHFTKTSTTYSLQVNGGNGQQRYYAASIPSLTYISIVRIKLRLFNSFLLKDIARFINE